jgi:hypothetical protein
LDHARTLFGALPKDYAAYASRYGTLTETVRSPSRSSGTAAPRGRTLLGLTRDADTDARHTARILRALYRLPEQWIPIELLPDRQVVCVDATSTTGAVAVLDLDHLDLGAVPYAPSLLDYVYDWLTDLYAIASTLGHIRRQQDAIAAGKRAADQLDRPGDWTVTRMCSQDVVFAVLRGRHNREYNRYDLSVFATATLTSFAPGSAVRAALAAALSDAYRSGGPLAVSFGADGNGVLPGPLRRWAAERGITLPRRGGWDVATGERLYLHATDLTDGTRALLPQPGVSTAAVCHAVASDHWAPEAVEALLRWSPTPQHILTGATSVTDRLGWIIDRQTIRAALVVAAAARVLRRRETLSDDDDSGVELTVTFDPAPPDGCDASVAGVELAAGGGQSLQLPWRTLVGTGSASEGLRLHVLAVENHLLAGQLRPLVAALSGTGGTVVVPADANTNTDGTLADALAEADRAGVHVVAAPDYTTTLDVTGERALAHARTARS